MRLRLPSGEWTILAKDSKRMCPFYCSHNTDTLYRSYREEWHRNGEFYYDCHTITKHNTYSYTKSENVKSLPADTSLTEVMDTKDGWRVSGHQQMMEKAHQREEEDTFMEYLKAQDKHIPQHYAQVDFLSIPIKIYELLKSTNKVRIATDIGAIPLKESLGFVVADEEGTILLTCFGQPSGNDPLSCRSEICAFLAAIRLATLLNKYYEKKLMREEEITRSKVKVYTDSLSMIKKLKAYGKYPTAPLLTTVLDSEWDVLSALHRALKQLTRYPKISWVKSHQDDKRI
jgi:hypothetical protein